MHPLQFYIIAFNGELEMDGIEERIEDPEILANFYAFEEYVKLNGGPRAYYDKVMARIPVSLWDIATTGKGLTFIAESIKSQGLSWRRILDFMIVTNLTDSWKELYDVSSTLGPWNDWIKENGGWKAMRKYVRLRVTSAKYPICLTHTTFYDTKDQ